MWFLKKKNVIFFSAVNFFHFLVIKTWIRIGILPKMLDPDSKPCLKVRQTRAASSASLSDSFPARSRTNSCRRFQATTCPRINFFSRGKNL